MAPEDSGNQPQQKKGFRVGFGEGTAERDNRPFAGLRESILRDTILNPKNTEGVFSRESPYDAGGRAGKFLGALYKDVATDGSRVPYWALNHPLAAAAAFGGAASRAAGLAPDEAAIAEVLKKANPPVRPTAKNIRAEYDENMGFATRADPTAMPALVGKTLIPLLASAALIQSSGNHDMLNLLGGGRTAGYEAVIQQEGNNRQTANLAGEILARYILGRTGRLLPWEEFTQERPDIGPSDFGSYRAHQYDKGLFDIGFIKGTTRNLEGEPEFTMMGFRTPLSSAAAAGGAMAGGVVGAIQAAKDLQDNPGQRAWMGAKEGPRRMAGALAGGVLGAIAGNLGSKAVNAAVVQPLLNPQAVADQAAWLQQQRALGLV